MKRFDRSNGLDTVLYKNINLTFFHSNNTDRYNIEFRQTVDLGN